MPNLTAKVAQHAISVETAEALFKAYEAGADLPSELLSPSSGAPASWAPTLPPARAGVVASNQDMYIDKVINDLQRGTNDQGNMKDAVGSILERHRQGRSSKDA